MFGKKTVCCVVLNGDSPLILLLIRLRSLSPRSALVHPQRGLCVMAYSCLHETSNFCPGFVEKGARTARSRAALQRCLRDAPVPDPACERPRKRSSEDRRKPWVRFANGEECHTRLRREGPRRAHARLLSPQARACRIRQEKRRGFKGDAPPLSEGVRTRVESVDFGDGRRCGLRGGADRRAPQRGDRAGDAFAGSGGSLDAKRWLTSPDPLYERKKGGATG